ncbi:Rgg/GadR/MutR family transcriptional regulator [Lacticaseibacillus sharpeae]|uniref:HTH cro/C1-type domain-containing protein n=1 Tax=Lacticaseibacillus sharpeae JCM 1186 = DSM 20505 TaxID=1291052 RepID=A0A0R1ZSJ8_9LACO|nr:Rgg/GadR/MutR family transcriptional regulator [Lacticaseibacillus sharpeae]KRM54987.1 hypothetical protein FC18_GL001694 [Lacticaseibacillus sharpeae JCM 1186 = DSM 20505]
MLGENFRQLRQDRGIALKDVAKGVVSVATVSKFENDVADLTAGKVTKLLNNMGVTFREFASLSDRSTGHAGAFLFKVISAYRAADADGMRKIVEGQVATYRASKSMIDFADMMSAAGLFCDLTGEVLVDDSDLERLSTNLRSLPEWNEDEVILFGNSLTLLPDNQVYLLARELLNRLDDIRSWNMSLYQDGWTALLNAAEVLMMRDSAYAQVLLRLFNDQEIPLTISLIIYRRRFLNLCYIERNAPTPENKEELRELLDMFKYMSANQLYNRYTRSVKEILDEIL